MANQPFSTVGGYGGNASLVTTPSGLSGFLDDVLDGFPTLHPQLSAGGGPLTAIVIDPSAIGPATGMPELNAILVELRVLNTLIREQMGISAGSYDLQTMRADEAWNTNIATGAL